MLNLFELETDINSLNEDMLITSYIGFDNKYRPMDEETCLWVQHNFKGASTIIERDGSKHSLSVDHTKPGDSLIKIT